MAFLSFPWGLRLQSVCSTVSFVETVPVFMLTIYNIIKTSEGGPAGPHDATPFTLFPLQVFYNCVNVKMVTRDVTQSRPSSDTMAMNVHRSKDVSFQTTSLFDPSSSTMKWLFPSFVNSAIFIFAFFLSWFASHWEVLSASAAFKNSR